MNYSNEQPQVEGTPGAGVGSEGDSKSPSKIAKSWQGSGQYPGVDDYVDVTVEKGTILYRGVPDVQDLLDKGILTPVDNIKLYK